MTTFPGSPRVQKGALVGVDPFNPLASVVVFQYNPDLVTRTVTAQTSGGNADRGEALRLKGPPEEKITLDIQNLTPLILEGLRKLPHLKSVDNVNEQVILKYSKGVNNLRHLLDFLQKEDLSYSRVFSELPTLNDVFLEITGKELRD